MINRREAIRRASWLLGGTLMAPTIAGVLQGCAADPELDWQPAFFTQEQARMITILSDLILPKTDTPAASELGVPAFIEQMVSQIYKTDRRDKFMASLTAFDDGCKAIHGKSFIRCSAEKQFAYFKERHALIKQNNDEADRSFIWQLKELTITGYCTTEVGATQLLQYKPIPAEYKACISLEEAGGKAWAT